MGYSKEEVYEILKDIPLRDAQGGITEGALVLEGGAFRGVYQEGVLDCLMDNGFNFETTVGVSAGALNGVSYSIGQVGRTAHVNIRYRHDGRYVGLSSFIKSHLRSLIGFDFVFGKLPDLPDIDVEKLRHNGRRFVAVATNLETGRAEYFENYREDIMNCVRASSTLPYISRPVYINDIPYLDGGCGDRIPFKWALNEGYKKVVVIRTRNKDFRIPNNFEKRIGMTRRLYGNYKEFALNLAKTDVDYNDLCDELERYEDEGKVFVIYPSEPINIKMLEGDLHKLKYLYDLGYKDAKNSLEKLKEYLENDD